jgi:hypothetical protein
LKSPEPDWQAQQRQAPHSQSPAPQACSELQGQSPPQAQVVRVCSALAAALAWAA